MSIAESWFPLTTPNIILLYNIQLNYIQVYKNCLYELFELSVFFSF